MTDEIVGLKVREAAPPKPEGCVGHPTQWGLKQASSPGVHDAAIRRDHR